MINEQQSELIPLELGEILQLAREKKGLTLDAISRVIRVRPEVLASIEKGNTSHIPSVYLKGYIRNYARHLGVPTESVEHHIPQAKGSEPGVQSVFKESLPRNSSERWIKASSYVLASAVVIALVWQFTNEAVRFSQGDPLLRPAQNESDDQKPLADAGTTVGKTSEESNSPSGETHLRASIASMNLRSESPTVGRPVSASGAWAAIKDPEVSVSTEAALEPGMLSLSIVTSADSWVEIVDGSGAKIEMDLLRAGSRRNYSGTGPFKMLLGRASSVEVFQNGERIDLGPYTRGNVARLTLSKTEVVSPEVAAPEPKGNEPPATPAEQG